LRIVRIQAIDVKVSYNTPVR